MVSLTAACCAETVLTRPCLVPGRQADLPRWQDAVDSLNVADPRCETHRLIRAGSVDALTLPCVVAFPYDDSARSSVISQGQLLLPPSADCDTSCQDVADYVRMLNHKLQVPSLCT